MSGDTDWESWPWSVLGLDAAPDDPKAVRRAYAKQLKKIDAETDIAGFEALRQAYEAARDMVGGQRQRRSVTEGMPPRQERKRTVPVSQALTGHRPPADLPPLPKSADELEPRPEPAAIPDVTPEIPETTDDAARQAAPAPWVQKDLDDPDTVLQEANRLADSGTLDPKLWKPVLQSEALTEPWVSWEVQNTLVSHLNSYAFGQGMSLRNQKELFLAIDERFGWHSDGIAFLRRFPGAGELLAHQSAVLHAGTASGTQRAASPATGRSIPRLWWLALILGWLVLTRMGVE